MDNDIKNNDSEENLSDINKKEEGLKPVNEGNKEEINREEKRKEWLIKILSFINVAVDKIRNVWKTSVDVKDKYSVIDDIKKAFLHLNFKYISYAIIVFLLIIYVLSGIYVVNPGEEAIVRQFGKGIREGIKEGIHYRLPWPIETEDIVNVSEIIREGIGTVIPEHLKLHSPDKIQILTGDENVINIELIVQYRIKNPRDYLYNVDYPSYRLINSAIRYAATEIGGKMNVDNLLTISKMQFQNMVTSLTQKLLDEYRSGLYIVGVNIQAIEPPEEVAEAFRNVASAKVEKQKIINNAQGYANSIIAEAAGKAARLVREGEAYKLEVINKAKGEANRFVSILSEYKKNIGIYTKDVTRQRLYLETMEKIMPRTKKYVLESGSDREKINLKFINSK